MSNYTKTTNFTAKDTLPTGNAAKIIKGTDFDTEFETKSVTRQLSTTTNYPFCRYNCKHTCLKNTLFQRKKKKFPFFCFLFSFF